MTNGTKAKRMEFRIRHTIAYLRYVGQVQVVCSEPRKRPEGRRKYFACNDLKVTARQIMLAYRLRWAVEIFHKNVKQHLGFEDVATSGFASVMSHVHWVYCAYILRPRSWDRPLYAFRGGFKGAGASSTDSKIAANIERGF